MDAIVLDGEQRSTLAVTRSLGKRGVRVAVGAGNRSCLSSCSRYCDSVFQYPPPTHDPMGFMKAISEFANQSSPSVLFPMTDVSLSEVLQNRSCFSPTVRLPFVEYDKFLRVTDKAELFRMARQLGVSIPKTVISTECSSREVLLKEAGNIGYPVVVKPCFSKIRTNDAWTSAGVYYASDEVELERTILKDIFQACPFLIQEKVVGPGVGVFLLMRNGEALARFAHKRLREKPPSGGVSVLCESIEPPQDALGDAEKILGAIEWTGVAMVEFKLDQRDNNTAKLIEVNGRFWGSLQLAVASGVDFPFYLFQLANGEEINCVNEYKIGLKSRWELGDCDHLLIRLLKKTSALNLPPGSPKKLHLILDFMSDYFRPSVMNEIFNKDDKKPFIHELKSYVGDLIK